MSCTGDIGGGGYDIVVCEMSKKKKKNAATSSQGPPPATATGATTTTTAAAAAAAAAITIAAMDVTFEMSKGRQFSIEIGFFDTVLEIKQKIQKYEGLPASDLRLLFNGQELADDRDTEHYEILQNSRIQLLVPADGSDPIQPQQQQTPAADSEEASGGGGVQTARIRVVVKIPASKRQLPLDVDPAESVLRLKQRIHESEGIPVNRFALHHGGAEMQDQRALAEHGVSDRAEITVAARPLAPSSVTSAGGSGGGGGGGGPAAAAAKRLKLMVLPKCGTKKIPVEVNASDSVGEMRKELQKLQGQLNFHLPSDGYFFIYKQNVMDDDRSFRWHDVRNGDTIEIFNGSVTGGS